MARRRRRLKITSSSLFTFVVLLNLVVACTVSHHHTTAITTTAHHKQTQQQNQDDQLQGGQAASSHQHQHHHHQQQQHNNNINNSNNHHHHHAGTSVAHLCAQLPSEISKQLKLCKLIGQSAEADRAVSSGTSKGLAECRNQFQTERWNCTHAHGDHHLLTSELAQSVGNKEGAFVHAVAAAGIVHSIATACSVGSLSHCACDKTRVGPIRLQEENWKWGGCSNNIRHGMLFAKHLVELLDASHQHSRTAASSAAIVSSTSTSGDELPAAPKRLLTKRSLSSRHREPNQLRGRPIHGDHSLAFASAADGGAQAAASALLSTTNNSQQQPAQALSFCQRNHTNISQAAHMQLIKSLLSKNSLEKHQSFRLAMNMHNNKVGRMAVAENMEFRCRCHGLSGSCSLKTCWLTLPNFQVIGAYLKRKYEASVHLPTAVNLNKLIPMMDRNEISAILSQQSQQQLTEAVATRSTATVGDQQQSRHHQQQPQQQQLGTAAEVPAPEFAPLVSSSLSPVRLLTGPTVLLSGHNLSVQANNPIAHYYDRHKQIQALGGAQQRLAQYYQQHSTPPTTQLQTSDEIPVNLAPMTQQQYQALLRDMKLCNNNSNSSSSSIGQSTTSYLTGNFSHNQQLRKGGLNSKRLQHSSQQQLINGLNGQHLKVANQHLSQVLHSNKDDLIHLHKSPDYCEADPRHGFAGVQSRVCSENLAAPDNCDKLCCGRGYTTHVYQHSYKCDCKFQYCCSIWCSVCEKEIKLVVCN